MNVTLPLHHNALRQPNHPAVIGERKTLTYRQLDGLVWRGAAYFRRAGLNAGDRVVLKVSDPLLHVVTSLALARLGVAYLAVTPAESPLMIDQLVQRIAARAVVGRSATREIRCCAEILVGADAFSAGGKISRDLMCEDSEQLWRLRTSSGTTGKPKLIAASHAGFRKYLRPLELGMPTAESDIFLSLSLPYFSAAASKNLAGLTRGATVVVRSSMATADSVLNLMTRARVNR